MIMWESFYDELEKIALSKITKYLLSLPKSQRAEALKKLPKKIREQQSYKLLGHEAKDVAARMPDKAGHGAEHVFSVTRKAQKFSKDMPEEVRRRATLGALLHDVGREAEGRVRKRIGKKAFKADPSSWHSELGGRYVKQFLRRNKELAKSVPGLEKGQLSGVVRAHDTDIHKVAPWTRKQLMKDPASGTVYLADKAEGMGRVGAERTIQMAKKFKESVPETMGVAQKNIEKYRGVVSQPYVTPTQRRLLEPQIQEYQHLMRGYGRTGRLMPAGPAAMSRVPAQRVPAQVIPMRQPPVQAPIAVAA